MKTQNKKINKSAGYTLVELLFYVFLFSVLTLVTINALITMTRSFKETAIMSELASGSNIMERISRETRKALDITSITSTSLKLSTTDDVGAAKTVEFLLVGSNLQLLENNVVTGNLNASNIEVTALSFTQITTVRGKAVKITMTIRSSNDTQARTVDFYDTVVLRSMY